MNIKNRYSRAAIAAVLACWPIAQAHAADYFLRIDGIPGESLDDRHAGQIEVQSWSVSAATPATASGKAKAACLKDITFTKPLDKASPLLLANAVSGMTIPTATFVAVKSTSGGAALEYLRIDLKDVLVTSVQDAGSQGATAPVESITLGFGSLNLQYKAQQANGSLGDAVQAMVKGGC